MIFLYSSPFFPSIFDFFFFFFSVFLNVMIILISEFLVIFILKYWLHLRCTYVSYPQRGIWKNTEARWVPVVGRGPSLLLSRSSRVDQLSRLGSVCVCVLQAGPWCSRGSASSFVVNMLCFWLRPTSWRWALSSSGRLLKSMFIFWRSWASFFILAPLDRPLSMSLWWPFSKTGFCLLGIWSHSNLLFVSSLPCTSPHTCPVGRSAWHRGFLCFPFHYCVMVRTSASFLLTTKAPWLGQACGVPVLELGSDLGEKMASDHQPGWEGLTVSGIIVHVAVGLPPRLDVTGGKGFVASQPFLFVAMGALACCNYISNQEVEVCNFVKNLEIIMLLNI